MTDELLAGVARADVTPPVGIAHAGWIPQEHDRAAGIDLPLQATALAVSDGDQTTVTVDIDVVLLLPDQATSARERIADRTGVPESNVRHSYSHTHSGPIVGWESWVKGAEMMDPYFDLLEHHLTGVAAEAVNDLRPARVAAGTGRSEIAVNRGFERPEDGRVIVGRNWEGPVDHEVCVLRFDTAGGDPLAAVANYACHPITVGPDNDLITPDFPGPMRRVVERSTGATCLFLQGAGGDVGPIRGVARNGLNEYKPLGRRLGHEVARVWWSLDPMDRQEERYVETLESGAPLAVYEDDTGEPPGSLRAATRELTLPLREFEPVEESEAEYQRHLDQLYRLESAGAPTNEIEREQVAAKRTAMHRNQAEAYGDQSTTTFELQVFAVGTEVATVAMPGEPFVGIGKRIKADSPFETTLFSGFSNVGTGYIPTPDAYGSGRFEVEITPFTPEAADVIVEEALAFLRELIP